MALTYLTISQYLPPLICVVHPLWYQGCPPPRSSPCHCTNWDLVAEQHIKHFHSLLVSRLPVLSEEVVLCVDPFCKSHLGAITDFLHSLIDCISVASAEALPSVAPICSRRVPGWNDGARDLKCKANFWHRVWLETGSPTVGILAVLKRKAKSRYKYEVRRLRRREYFIKREKPAAAFSVRNRKSFWGEVKRLRESHVLPCIL